MFSLFQLGVASQLAISGAMVVAASATVGLLGQEGSTLRKTILPTLYYLLVVGSLGLLAVYGLGLRDPVTGAI